jgi:hypothetical protein
LESTKEKQGGEVMETNIVRKVAAEMMNTSMQDITAEVIYGWATLLGDAATCKKKKKRRRIRSDDPEKLLHKYWRDHYEI